MSYHKILFIKLQVTTVFCLLVLFIAPVKADVTFYANDFSGWQDDWENFTQRRIEAFATTASNIARADEVSAAPSANTGVGNTLTFPEFETDFCRAFVVKTLESGANFTFDDDEGAGNLPSFDNALSIGDIDNFQNDDFEILFPANEAAAYAVSFGIQDSTDVTGESVQVFGNNNVLLATLNNLPADANFTIGIISTEPITRVVFNEGAGGDDIAVKDFAFDRANANDSDGDGLSDCEEVTALGSNPFAYDTDEDGLGDGEETNIYGSGEQAADTDGDQLNDGFEVALQTLISGPGSSDSDGDNLSDGLEVNTLGTDPGAADTDGDSVNDDVEVANNLDPLHPDTDGDGLDDNTDPSPTVFDSAATLTGTSGSGTAIDLMQTYTATYYLIAVDESEFNLEASDIRSGRAILGEIREFAPQSSGLVPTGWLRAEGQLLLIASYPALFEVLGNTYGGDGVVDFALPDLRGRTPIGAGAAPGRPFVALGEQRGELNAAITTGQLPVHDHGIPTGDTTRNAGADNALPLEQPSLGLNFILATRGDFGSILDQGLSEIRIWPGRNPPNADWVFCHGQLFTISANSALFSLLGTLYGGNGATTFALPDLRARSIRITDNFSEFGDVGGAYDIQLTQTQLSAHSHKSIAGSLLDLDSSGSGIAFSINQPSLSMRRLIATQGAFPSLSSPSLGITDLTLGEMRYYPSTFINESSGVTDTANQTISIASNSALYALLLTTYGGDGMSTFALPQGNGRVAIGAGVGSSLPSYGQGAVGGASEVTLTLANLPSHAHSVVPSLIDSDEDGLFDSEEDLNNNGVQDLGETDLLNSDSDNDSYTDGEEVDAGSDPLDPASIPSANVPLPAWSLLLLGVLLGISGVRFNYRIKGR